MLAIAFQLTALALLATPSEAFAQLPGEWGNYIPENDGGQNLSMTGAFSEARNGGHLLRAWRGADNQVWMSVDNGNAFTIGVTQTFVPPAVVAFGPNDFLCFHTGTDGTIWLTGINTLGSTVDFGDSWFSVPGNTTNMGVSVVQMFPNSEENSFEVYMVYRGLGNDQRVWGTWLDFEGNWSTPENISGGLGNSSPAISLNPVSNRLTVTVAGTDNQLWMTSQALGAHGWNSWTPMGVDTFDTPHSAACANGNMVVSIRDINSRPEFAKFDAWGNQQSGFSVDTTGWQTNWAVQLTANGNSVYSLFNGFDTLGYWKQVYDCN